MIKFKLFAGIAALTFLTGCIMIDADDVDHNKVSVLHLAGDQDDAWQEAARMCEQDGERARLIEVEKNADGEKQRSVFECR